MSCLHSIHSNTSRTILENSVASLVYQGSRFGNVPGSFVLTDKITDRVYWQSNCYDGGEGWSNKDESVEKTKGIAKVVELTKLYHKITTPEDLKTIAPYTERGQQKALSKKLSNGVTVTISGPIDGCSINDDGTINFT